MPAAQAACPMKQARHRRVAGAEIRSNCLLIPALRRAARPPGWRLPAWWTTQAVKRRTAGVGKRGLDGYGSAHTDTLYQQVAVPSSITTATLTLWLHIDTAETTTTTAYDTLKVQIRNTSGTVLATLGTYSNLNAASGYTQKTFDVSAYKGQTIQVYLVGAEDSTQQTSFVVDDFALNVQ